MKKLISITAICILLVMAACQTKTMNREPYAWPEGISAPMAIKKPRTFVQHGDTLVDDYYWMNDFFKKGPDSNLVVEYLRAENDYLDTMMAGTKDFQVKLIQE